MTDYLLRLNDEPDEPVRLSQRDFDFVIDLGVERGTPAGDNTVAWASVETVEADAPFTYRGQPAEEDFVADMFGRGLEVLIRDSLDRLRAGTDPSPDHD